MADTNNNATVEVPEDGVVTVDISDSPDLANVGKETTDAVTQETAAAATTTEEPKPEKKKPLPRVRLAEDAAKAAADEATATFTQAIKTAEDARKAAEATALAERRAREDAQRLAQQHQQEALEARGQAEASELAVITTGIENATRELATYQDEMQRALEAGEFAKVTAAQTKLSRAAAVLDRLEVAKINYDSGQRKAATATTEGRVAPQQQVSAFEQYVSSFAPVAQAWLRAHPDCVPAQIGGSTTKNSAMMAGHYDALAKSIPEGTPEYFKVIEEHTGYRAPTSAAASTTAAGEEEVDATAPKPRKQAQPSAPVSREPPNAQGQVPRTTRSVTLSKEQQEAAKLSWPTLPPQQAFAQYARNLLELEAEGKMGRLSH